MWKIDNILKYFINLSLLVKILVKSKHKLSAGVVPSSAPSAMVKLNLELKGHVILYMLVQDCMCIFSPWDISIHVTLRASS